MNAKEYLLQYKAIDAKIKILQAEIEALRTDAEGMSINLDGMPKGHGAPDKTARLAVLLAECETALTEKLSEAWRMRMEIISTLGKLSNAKHQQILHSRYIKGDTWERIAVDMDITWRYCYMLHGSALAELEKILNKN